MVDRLFLGEVTPTLSIRMSKIEWIVEGGGHELVVELLECQEVPT